MQKYFINIIIFFTALLPFAFLKAQIGGNGDSYYIDTITLEDDSTRCFLVVFNSEIGDPFTGSIVARPADTNFIEGNFEWYSYDTATGSFNAYHTDTNVGFSGLPITEPSGFRVDISDTAGYNSSFYAWVLFNQMKATIPASGFTQNCYNIEILPRIEQNEMVYFDYADTSKVIIKNPLSYAWEADPQKEWEEEVEQPQGEDVVDVTPPPVNTIYRLTISDVYENSSTDEIFYESEVPYAKYEMWIHDSWKLANKDNPDIAGSGNTDSVEININEQYSSPSKVYFINKSLNTQTYEWFYILPSTSDTIDQLIDYYPADSVYNITEDSVNQRFTYYYPGTYYSKLITENKSGCTDTFPRKNERIDHPIKIASSNYKPFSPPGPGKQNSNPAVETNPDNQDDQELSNIPNLLIIGDQNYGSFKILNTSFRDFHIAIYDKWGRKIYEKEVNYNIDEWQGWDGSKKGKGNAYVPEGVYFFVIIDLTGWDGEEYEKDGSKKQKNSYTGAIFVRNKK